MKDIYACAEILNIRILDTAFDAGDESEIFFYVGHPAQECCLRMLIETLRADWHRYRYAKPFLKDKTMDKDALEVWKFGVARQVEKIASIRQLAVPMGFVDNG